MTILAVFACRVADWLPRCEVTTVGATVAVAISQGLSGLSNRHMYTHGPLTVAYVPMAL